MLVQWRSKNSDGKWGKWGNPLEPHMSVLGPAAEKAFQLKNMERVAFKWNHGVYEYRQVKNSD